MIALAFIFLGLISLSKTVGIRKEHSLSGPYIAGGDNLLNWELTGSAQLGVDFIRLTTDEEHKQGAIWNTFPSFSNNWEFQVQFHIHGKGVFLNGDGMAIWYVPEDDILHGGPVFGSKDYFYGLGIFIDTLQNQEEPHKDHHHPYISAMVNNGSLHYANEEDGTGTEIGGCHAVVRNLEVPTRIAVSYIGNILAVYLDNQGLNQWLLCFKAEGVYLPTGYFFGISASTSAVSDNHDIIGVATLNMDLENQEFIDNSEVVPRAENVQISEKYNKEEVQKVEKKREIKEAETETADSSIGEDTAEPTSLIRKLVYLTGAALVILVSISMYRKYSERRRERMEKRLY